MTNLSDVKVGDNLIHYYGFNGIGLIKVSKITEKQIISGSSRFWKDGGKEVGNSTSLFSSYVVKPTPELYKQIDCKYKKNKVLNLWKNINLPNEIESLEEIIAVLEKYQ